MKCTKFPCASPQNVYSSTHCVCSLLPELLQYRFSFGNLFHLGIDHPELYSLMYKEGIIFSGLSQSMRPLSIFPLGLIYSYYDDCNTNSCHFTCDDQSGYKRKKDCRVRVRKGTSLRLKIKLCLWAYSREVAWEGCTNGN